MRTLWFAGILAILATSRLPAETLGDVQVGFSADRALVFDGRQYLGKIWAMPGRERHEQAIQAFRPVFLLRADRHLGEIVLARLKTVVQFVIPPELRLLTAAKIKKRPVGRENVNSIATTKYMIDETLEEGRAKGVAWISADGIPMRLEGSFTRKEGRVSTLRWELSHVKIGPQPMALFEAPASGFTRLPPAAIGPLLGLKLKAAGK